MILSAIVTQDGRQVSMYSDNRVVWRYIYNYVHYIHTMRNTVVYIYIFIFIIDAPRQEWDRIRLLSLKAMATVRLRSGAVPLITCRQRCLEASGPGQT